MKPHLAIATVILLSCTSSAALASTLTIDQQNSDHIFADENGQNKWWTRTSFRVGDHSSGTIAAGVFRLQQTLMNGATQKFLAFCLEPMEGLELPQKYRTFNQFSPSVQANLNALGVHAWDKVSNWRTAAAFQMAVWEITTETGVFDIDDGHFRITKNSRRSNRAEKTAQSWLDKISDGTWTSGGEAFEVFATDGSQDLFTDIPAMPLPGSGLMLVGALAGASGLTAARRRKVK
jgi:hypothetical protein